MPDSTVHTLNHHVTMSFFGKDTASKQKRKSTAEWHETIYVWRYIKLGITKVLRVR